MGRGTDLLEKTQAATDEGFREVFGDSVGRYLYRTAHGDMVAQWSATTYGKLYAWGIVAFPIAIVFLSILAWRQPSKDKVFKSLFYTSCLGSPYFTCCLLGLWYGGAVAILSVVVAFAITLGFFCFIAIYMKNQWDSKAPSSQDAGVVPYDKPEKRIQ